MFKEHQDKILSLYNKDNLNPRAFFFTSINDAKILYSPPSKQHDEQMFVPLDLNVYYKQPIQDEEDLKLILTAPIALPIVCLSVAAKRGFYAIKYLVFAGLQLATGNFEDRSIQNSNDDMLKGAKSYCGESAKQAMTALYYTFTALMDALISVITLLTRIAVTCISMCQKINSKPTADDKNINSKNNDANDAKATLKPF